MTETTQDPWAALEAVLPDNLQQMEDTMEDNNTTTHTRTTWAYCTRTLPTIS